MARQSCDSHQHSRDRNEKSNHQPEHGTKQKRLSYSSCLAAAVQVGFFAIKKPRQGNGFGRLKFDRRYRPEYQTAVPARVLSQGRRRLACNHSR